MPEISDELVALKLYMEDVVCALKMGPEYRDYKVDGLVKWTKHWQWQLSWLAANPEHFGDCTGAPMTCVVCYVASERQEAAQLLETLWKFCNEGYPEGEAMEHG